MFKKKTKWAKILGGVAMLKALPKKPIAGMAALLGGGYVAYRTFMRSSRTRQRHQMQAA